MEKNIYGKLHDHKREFARVDNAPITERNKELIKEFLNRMLTEGNSEVRILKLGAQLRNIAEWFGKDFDEVQKEDIERVVREIQLGQKYTRKRAGGRVTHHTHSAETKADYKRCIKQFYKWWKGNGETYPEEVRWIKATVKMRDRRYMDDILSPKDILKAAQHCNNKRDTAFMMFLFESGGRIGEILSMRVRDFWQEKHCAKARLRGKTGERTIPVVNSVPYLSAYLAEHPLRDTPSAPLWVSLSTYHHRNQLMYQGAVKVIDTAFEKAKINKKHNPHLFRHSRASELAKVLTEAQLCQYFGWVLGSEQVRRYVHISGRLDSSMLRYNGVPVEQEHQEDTVLRVRNCSRCGLENGASSKYCSQCSAALDLETAMEAERLVKEETDKTMQFLMEIMEDPHIMEQFRLYKAQKISSS